MAGEANVRANLQIRKGNINYNAQPGSFSAVVTGSKGPTPGAVEIDTVPTIITFTELVQPGLCRIMNLDTTNRVAYGILIGGNFYPIHELLPGETYPCRWARDLGYDEGTDTGSGTSGTSGVLAFKANGAPVNVLIECFEV